MPFGVNWVCEFGVLPYDASLAWDEQLHENKFQFMNSRQSSSTTENSARQAIRPAGAFFRYLVLVLLVGLVPVAGDVTPVRIFMQNSGQVAIAHVPTPAGHVRYSGEARIDGVPGLAAPLIVEFEDIAGASCGALLPTGNAVDVLDAIEVTCIDNGMPVVLLRAQELGCSGYESPAQLGADSALKARLESIRLQAGLRMNLGDVRQRNVPKMCLVALSVYLMAVA